MAANAFAMPSTRRLPEGWSELEIVEDTIVADGLSLRRAGVAAVGPTGEEVTGSAAEHVASPIARSTYELLERVSTLEAMNRRRSTFSVRTLDGSARGIIPLSHAFLESDTPKLWRPARSNAIALNQNWQTAALRAYWELVERDRVLRSWYGGIAPRRLDVDWSTTPLAATTSYEWIASALSEADDEDVRVASVFGIPRRDDLPVVFGFGARPSAEGALEAAIREAMQVLAFLWGEPVSTELPTFAPSAGYHLEYWQLPAHRDRLRRWLDGEHVRYALTRRGDVSFGIEDVAFVDLTPPWLAEAELHVAKALCPWAVPLLFGDSPLGAHLPPELRVHPIA